MGVDSRNPLSVLEVSYLTHLDAAFDELRARGFDIRDDEVRSLARITPTSTTGSNNNSSLKSIYLSYLSVGPLSDH